MSIHHEIICTEPDSTTECGDVETCESVECEEPGEATVPPMHTEESLKIEQTRAVVLETCAQLLKSVETVKLSLLQLQYAMHSCEMGVQTVESKSRSHQLWSWGPSSGSTTAVVFPPNAVEELLPNDFFHVFEGAIDTNTLSVEHGGKSEKADHNA